MAALVLIFGLMDLCRWAYVKTTVCPKPKAMTLRPLNGRD